MNWLMESEAYHAHHGALSRGAPRTKREADLDEYEDECGDDLCTDEETAEEDDR